MLVKELITKLGFKVDTAALSKYESSMKSLRNTSLALGTIAVGAIAGVGTTLFMLAKSAGEAADSLDENAQKVGVTTDFLQKFSYMADVSGTSVEGLMTGVKMLSRRFIEARDKGGDAAEEFTKIGINPKQIASSEDLLLRLSDKFSKMKDGPEKTALALKLFGRSGVDMIPLLNTGTRGLAEMAAEVSELGYMFTDADKKAGDLFDKRWKMMGVAVDGLKKRLGSALVPVITDLINKILDWYKAHKKLIDQKIDQWAKKLVEYIKQLPAYLDKLVKVTSFLVDNMSTLLTIAKSLAVVFGVLFIADTISRIVSLTSAVWKLGASMIGVDLAAAPMLVTIGLIAVGLIALGSIIYQLTTRWDDFVSSIGKSGQWIKTALGFQDADKDQYGQQIYKPKEFPAIAGITHPLLSSNPSTSPAFGGGAQMKNIEVKHDTKIEVNVQSGADAREIADQIKDAVEESKGDLTTTLMRTLEGGAF